MPNVARRDLTIVNTGLTNRHEADTVARMRLLMIEDDELFGSAMHRSLQRAGYAVDWFRDADQLEVSISTVEYECVLLDLGLPSAGGEACLATIRQRLPGLPVIIISARGGVVDRVKLLELGADDYLVKPVDLEEVNMRVTAVTRRVRMANGGDEVLTHGPLALKTARRLATWHGNVVPLTTREFWLLEVFLRKKDQLLSRDKIEEALYGWGEEIASNAVEVYIHHLRRKFYPELISTVRGAGYRLGEAMPGG